MGGFEAINALVLSEMYGCKMMTMMIYRSLGEVPIGDGRASETARLQHLKGRLLNDQGMHDFAEPVLKDSFRVRHTELGGRYERSYPGTHE